MARPTADESTAASCRVCGSATSFIFKRALLGHEVDYFQCPKCGYVQTEEPHWLDQAYESAINLTDCGLVHRNERMRKLVVQTMAMLGILKGKVIDCAGGYGLLVRMLRDWGVDARWNDPYCGNLMARGFEARKDEQADLVTAFEAFEHFVDPLGELGKLLERGDNVLFSTALVSVPAPKPEDWWYYCFEHGQHVGFLSTGALQVMAERFNCHFRTDGRSFHLFTKAPLPAWKWFLFRNTRFLARPLAKCFLKPRIWSDYAELEKGNPPG
jgi:hypothetical protein